MIIQIKLTPNAKGTQKLCLKRYYKYMRRRQKDIPGRQKMRRQGVWKKQDMCMRGQKTPRWNKRGKERGFDLEVRGPKQEKSLQAKR